MESFSNKLFQMELRPPQHPLDTAWECRRCWQSATPCSNFPSANQQVSQPYFDRWAASCRQVSKSHRNFCHSMLDIEYLSGVSCCCRLWRQLGMSEEVPFDRFHPYRACWVSQPAHDFHRRWLEREKLQKFYRMIECRESILDDFQQSHMKEQST